MKKATFLILALSSQFSLAQKMIVGSDTLTVEQFKKEQHTSLQKDGVSKTIESVQNFLLLQKFAQEKKADTMAFFRERMGAKINELENEHFYPKTLVDKLLNQYVNANKTERNILIFAVEKKADDTNNYQTIYNDVISGKISMEDAIKKYTGKDAKATYLKPGIIAHDLYNEIITLNQGGYTKLTSTPNYVGFAKLINTRPSLGYTIFGTLGYPKDENSAKKRKEILDALSVAEDFSEVTAKFGTTENEKKNGGVIMGSPTLPDEIYIHAKKAQVGQTVGPILYEDQYFFFHIYQNIPYELNDNTKAFFKKEMLRTNYIEVLNKDFSDELRKSNAFKQNTSYEEIKKSYPSLQSRTDDTTVLYQYQSFPMTIGELKKLINERFKDLEKISPAEWNLLMDSIRNEFVLAAYTSEFLNKPEVKNELNNQRKMLYSEYVYTQYLKKIIEENPQWLQDFYNKNKSQYQLPEQAKARIAMVADEKLVSSVSKDIKAPNNWKSLIEKYDNQLNDKQQILVDFQEGFLDKNSEVFSDKKITFKKGVYTTKIGDRTAVIAIDEILPQRQMTQEEAKIQLLSDVSDQKLKELLETERAKTKIVVEPNFITELERNFKK